MRDKEYSLKPPPHTYRIALLGSSFSLGGGVPVGQTHESLLEDRLNREGPGAPQRRYEILNFSVGQYGILQYFVLTDRKVFNFSPNAVIVVFHSLEANRLAIYLTRMIRDRVPIPYPYMQAKLREVGVRPEMEEPELRRRLRPIVPDLIKWMDRRIVEMCRARGVTVIAIPFPIPLQNPNEQKDLANLATIASQAGMRLLVLQDAYRGYPVDSLHLPGDGHLNVLGHKVVADRLFERLREDDAKLLRLGFTPAK
jgi:hypothetical protein